MDLSVSVRNKTLLHGVSFKAPDSECTGVVGPNGSGKTILLESIMGLHSSSGSVLFGSNDLHAMDFCGEGIYYVPEIFPSFDMTVRRNLEFFYRCYNRGNVSGMDKEIDEILDAVRLRGREDSPVDFLSLGLRRRLAYATTMVSVPSLLVMDEPFANLDADGREYLGGYLRTLKLLGTTMVIASNDLAELERVCDSIVFMNRGYMVENARMTEGTRLREACLSTIWRWT